MVTWHTGQSVSTAKLQGWTLRELRATFTDPYSQQTAAAMLELLGEQRRIQHSLEKQVLAVVKPTGPIGRFASAGDYASYCSAVNSHCESDGKKKGEGNRKNGNKHQAGRPFHEGPAVQKPPS